MGYRSDVKVEIKIDGMTPQDILIDIEEKIKVAPQKIFNVIYSNSQQDSLILVADNVKWYNKGIKAFENYLTNLINEIDDEEKEGFVYFIRLGENQEDFEELESIDASWQTCLQYVRMVEITQEESLDLIYSED